MLFSCICVVRHLSDDCRVTVWHVPKAVARQGVCKICDLFPDHSFGQRWFDSRHLRGKCSYYRPALCLFLFAVWNRDENRREESKESMSRVLAGMAGNYRDDPLFNHRSISVLSHMAKGLFPSDAKECRANSFRADR